MTKIYSWAILTVLLLLTLSIPVYGVVSQNGANYFGLSSDATPTTAVVGRSLFTETDTQKEFLVTAVGVRALLSSGTSTGQVVSIVTSSISTHASTTTDVHGFDAAGHVPYATLAAHANYADTFVVNLHIDDFIFGAYTTPTPSSIPAVGASGKLSNGWLPIDIANGLASLGSNTLVPRAQLCTGTADATTYCRGDGVWSAVSGMTVTNAQISIQSLGTVSSNFTVTFQDGCITKVTVTAAPVVANIADWPSATYGARCELHITQNPITSRVVTYGTYTTSAPTRNNIYSMGGLLSAGDALPNSGAGAMDIFYLCWSGTYWRTCGAEWDVKP